MAGSSIVSLVCLITFANICTHGPHLSAAEMTDGHDAVEKKMCEDLPSICPCNAHHLQVTADNTALVCGESQPVASMATLPTIKPPTGVTLDQDALYTVLMIDRDAPSRQTPSMRYWLHGLFSNITASDLSNGNIAKGHVLMEYERPNPPSNSGPHSYQILLVKQDPSVGDMDTGPLTMNRGQFKAQDFLTKYKMCAAGQLIGAFEFTCSNPDGADPVNPDRPCSSAEQDSSTAKPDETTAASGSPGPGRFIHAALSVVLFLALLV